MLECLSAYILWGTFESSRSLLLTVYPEHEKRENFVKKATGMMIHNEVSRI